MNYELYLKLIYVWMGIGVIVFFILLKVTAPYGRHASSLWGPQISNRWGWIIMEAPVLLILLYFVIANASNINGISFILVSCFSFHYINRIFIFPFRIRTRGKKMPWVIVGSAVLFNLTNGFFLGYYFAHFATDDSSDFFQFHNFFGIILFVSGIFINWSSDNTLIHLRQPGETNYKIPRGGLFNLISCPNLFGEMMEWSGYAILCWNIPALAFWVWTLANLIPRALAHHRWYKLQFENYPAERKAIIPYLW